MPHSTWGGVFLFDVWYGPGVLTDPPAVRVKKLQDAGQTIDKIAVPVMNEKKNTVDVNYEVIVDDGNGHLTRFKETHIMRYYFRPEIEYFLNQCNFELIDNYNSAFKNSGFDSWTSYFIAKAV